MKYIKRHKLIEGRSQNVELSEVIKFYKERCTQYNPKLNIIYRGVRDDKELYNSYAIVKPSEHERSAGYSNTTYVNIIDNLESWSDYPKRTKSIICSTDRGVSKCYGEVYVVIPTDNAHFGVCPYYDFQQCFKKFSSKFGIGIYRINELLGNRESGYSFEEFKYAMKSGDFNQVELSFDYRQYMSENKLSGIDVMNEMFEMLSPNVNEFRTFDYDGKTDISNLDKIQFLDSNEVWTSDDCILIKAMYYRQFLREIGVDEEFVSNLLV